jgi:iron complex outermembrane receptor protein
LPKQRFYTTVDWAVHDWDITLANTYIASTTDTGVNGTSTPEIPVDKYVSWDMRVAYDLHFNTSERNALKLAVGVNNLTDEMPPLAPRAFLDNNADASTFSPIGRLVYATVAYDF